MPTRLFFRNIKILFLLAIPALLISCGASRLPKKIDQEFEKAQAFEHGFAGLAVYDPEKDQMLYEYHSDKYFTPASNTKLFTFYTGLQVLGDSIPAFKYANFNDTIYIKGTGDPSFLNRDLPESKVYNFLKEAENLVYVSPSYTEKFFGPGWAWDDYNDYYSAERFAFPIYGSLVEFDFNDSGKLDKVLPAIFKDSLHYADVSENNALIQRNPENNRFEISLKKEKIRKWVPIKYSEEVFLKLLSDTLKKPVRITKQAPKELNRTLYSISADSLYKQMLQVSDNFIAEQILLMVSEKLSDSLKTGIAINYMKENELKDLPDEPVWRDGSGLSRYNLFTPRSLVALLRKIRETVPEDRLFNLLPAGGYSGTIKNYYQAEEPYIFAKTGSLSNNHSLSGYLKTKSGKTLIFSFMNSNFTIPSAELKKEMQHILEMIRDNY